MSRAPRAPRAPQASQAPSAPNANSVDANFEFDALESAANYRSALVAEFGPALSGTVVEVGAGIGQFTAGLLTAPAISTVIAVEPEARYCASFRERHPSARLVEGTIDQLPADVKPNAIVCVNVLEHIEHDLAELKKFAQRLAKGGHVCLFVPAGPEIYAPLDRDFGHFRRYTRAELRGKLEAAGLTVERLDYFNVFGYFTWWLNFKVLGTRRINSGLVVLFDRIVFPVVHALERGIARPPFGQSLIATARLP